MILRILRSVSAFTLFIGVALTMSSNTAHATFTITISQQGMGGSVTSIDNVVNDTNGALNNIAYATDFGDFADAANPGTGVQITGKTNSPGTNGSLGAFVTDTTITIRNSASGTRTLVIDLSSDGFTMPSSPILAVTTTISASDLTGTGSSAAYDTTVAGVALPTVSITTVNTVKKTAAVPLASTPYTITSQLRITLGAGETATVTGTTRALATPEPASIIMALSALPVLGVVYRRRRAKA